MKDSDQKSEGVLHFQSSWKAVGDPKQKAGGMGHGNADGRLAELQPGEEGCGGNKLPGSPCQNERSSFPSPFAAPWPHPLPCADPSAHLRGIGTDARQEHGAGKERAWEGGQSHWKSPATSGGTQRSRPAGTQRFPSSK